MYAPQEIANNVEAMFRQRGLNTTTGLKLCEVNGQAIQSMKARGSLPSTETLVKFSEFFNCSIDSLLGREVKQIEASSANDENSVFTMNSNNPTYDLSIEEQSIIKMIRKFDIKKKQKFLSILCELDGM